MRTPAIAVLAALAATLSLTTACGNDSATTSASQAMSTTPTKPADRTVDITMTDNKYDPASVQVTKGETIKFRFHNNGAMVHEAFIGSAKDQAHHDQEMVAMPDMNHASPDEMVTVKPGKSGDLTVTFDRTGETMIGCHQPGHWAAGMKATVDVT